MATWTEIKAKRQGQARAASSTSSWQEIKRSRGYEDPVFKEADRRRADASGRAATIVENRNAPAPVMSEDTGVIPSFADRVAAAQKAAVTAPRVDKPNNLAKVNRVKNVRTREQIAELLGALDKYTNPESQYTMRNDVSDYVDYLYKRTGGVDVENDRDFQWAKDSVAKGVPYNTARLGRLVGGGFKAWVNKTRGTVETLAGLSAEGLAAQSYDPAAAVFTGLVAGLASGDVRGSMEKSVGDALQRQRDLSAQKPRMLAKGSASFDRAAQNIEDVGGNDTLGSKIITMAASNAPDMILSMGIAGLTRAGATGVAKVAARQLVKDLTKKETRKAALTTIGKRAARSAIPEISTLPMGIKSFAGTYQSAKGKGADDSEAVGAALASAWVEAAIEGGGAQNVIKNAERGFRAWAKSTLGEGAEELWQDWLAPAAEKYIAGIHGIETFSMDPNADSIFNPGRAGTAALGGAVIGGVVGLPSMITESSYRDQRAPDPLRPIAEQMANRIIPEAAEAERQVAQRQKEQEEESRQKAEAAVEGKTIEASQPVKTAAISFSKYPDRKFEVRIYKNGERAIFEGDKEIGRGVTTEKARTSAGATLARERAFQTAKPIEARNAADMADRSTQAYQKMFPELREGIRGMALRALQDIYDGTKGEKTYITDGAGAAGLTETITGAVATRRSQSEMIDELQGYSADGGAPRMAIGRLKEALRNIAEGNDLVNRQIEKEVEQRLDYYLTTGTKDFRTGNPILPDKAYSDAKAFIYRARQMEGKRGYSYSETELADAEAALARHADRMEKDFGVRPEMKIVEPKKAVQKNIVKLLETVGMRAYYIDAKNEGNLAEYYDPNMPDVVFIKTGSKRDMSWAAGHGFFHSLKVNHPSLFKSAMDTFEKGITSEQIEKYLETFSETPDYQERLSGDKELLMEEMLADEMGNTWLSKGFWQDLMEVSQEVFEKIRALVEDFFDTILKGFDNYLGKKQVQEMYDKFVMITGRVQERVLVGQEEGKEASEYDSMREQPEVEDLPFSARKKTVLDGQMSLDSDEIKGILLKNHQSYKDNKEALELATQAITDLQKAETGPVSSIRGKLGAGIRTIAKAFSEPLVQSGRLAFIGQEIKNARDLASIAQILRDPRFETLRIVYMKKGVAVGYDAYSARLTGSAYPYAFKGEDQIKALTRDKKTTENQIHGELSTKAIMDLRKKLNRLGADGYYLIHNHPSGSMVPSSADVNMTGNYMTRAPGFKGHIIINHNKFVAMLSAADIQKEYAMSGVQKAGANLYYAVDVLGPQGNDPLRDTPIPHPLLGNKVLSGSALAAVAKELESEENSVSVVYTSGQGAIEGVEVVPAGFVKSSGFTGYLNNMRRANGAIRAFIVADDTVYPTVEKEIDALIITGHIMDATTYQSARTRAESGVSARTEPKGYERSYRVDETAAYSARRKTEIEEAFKDSKVRGDDGKLLEVYHGTDSEFFSFSMVDGSGRLRKKNGHMFGPGYYFTTKRRDAEGFGPRIMSAFVNITDPVGNEKRIGRDGYDWIISQLYEHYQVDVFYEEQIRSQLFDAGRLPPDSIIVTSLSREVDDPSALYRIVNDYYWYDGFAVKEADNETQYVAWFPEQIKSPDGENPVDMENPDIRYSIRKKPDPEKTIKAYKLMRVNPSEPGKLYPLFVGADQETPMGMWLDADEGPATVAGKVKSRLGPLAYRPGWHLGDLPLATHIGVKGPSGAIEYMNPNHVWVEADVAADKDYQPEANAAGINGKTGNFNSARADLKKLPIDGFYRFKTNPNMTGNWIITGAIKLNRVLSPEEVSQIVRSSGYEPMAKPDGSPTNESLGFSMRRREELAEPRNYERMFASMLAPDPTDTIEGITDGDTVQGFAGSALSSPQMPTGNDTSTWSKTADDIVKMVSEFFGVPVKTGRFRHRALGIFKVRQEVIRLKVANDIPVLSHELGHYLDKKNHYANATGTISSELLSLGRATSRRSYTKAQSRAEGVAEFVRLYLTNPIQATLRAPEFMKVFEGKLDSDTLQFMSDLRTVISQFNNLPVEKQVLADISRREPQRNIRERRNPFVEVYNAWVNERGPFIAIEKIRKASNVPGRDIAESSQLVHGLEAKVFNSFTDKQLDINNNEIGPSLQEILSPMHRTAVTKRGQNHRAVWDNFLAYIVARRAMDYKERGFAMPQPFYKYAATISKLEPKHPEFAQVFAGLRQYEDNNLKLLVDSGILSHEQAAEIKKLNPNHMPLYRIRDAVDAFRPGMGKHLGQSKNVIRRARGGGETIIDPIESIIADSFIIRRAAESNMVMRDLKNFADKAEAAGDLIEAVPPGIKMTEFTVEDIRRQLLTIAETENDDALKDAVANAGDEIMESALRVFNVDFAEQDGVISVYVDGIKKMYEVEQELYRAVKGLNKQQSHFLIRMLQPAKRLLQFGAVTTMDFVTRNMARDTLTSVIQSDAGINPIDIAIGYGRAAVKDKWFINFIRQGGGTEFLNLNSRLQAQIIEDDLTGVTVVDRFGRIGTAISEVKVNNNERTRGALKAEIQGLIGIPIRFIRSALNFSEAGPRVAEFKKGIEKGMLAPTAAVSGRNLSQDFNDAGYRGRELNKITAFFNSMVGGNRMIAKSFRDHPIRTTLRGMLYITVPQLLLYFLLNDGDDDYENLPEWKKATFFCIPLGDGKFFFLPKPFGYGFIFGSVPEIVLNTMKNKDLDGWRRAREQFLTHFGPNVIPNAISPIMDVAANRDPLSGAPIESVGQKRQFPYQRVSPGTSGNAEFIGQVTKNIDGGVSPKVVDYLVRRYTGSVGDFFWRLPDMVSKENVQAFSWEELPIVKGFTGDSVYTNQATDNFYTAGDEIAKIRGEIREGISRSVDKVPTDLKVEAVEVIDAFGKQFSDLSEQFTDDRKVMKSLKEMPDLTPRERERAQREIRKVINADAASFYHLWRVTKVKYGIR